MSTNSLQTQQKETKPRDGPATKFEADPLIPHLQIQNDEFFAIVLVAGWPPNLSQLDPPYQKLLEQVRRCCQEANVDCGHNLYLYPPKYLHITLTTLKLLEPFDSTKQERYDTLRTAYTAMILNASKDNGWPCSPLRLEVDKIQFGSKAGIIMWKETTGGLIQIRKLVKKYAEEAGLPIHAIPNIIHTTFVRYKNTVEPENGGRLLQQSFQTNIVNNISEFKFPSSLSMSSVSLVCERTPYMHIPNNDHHVFERIDLSTDNGKKY